MRLIQAYSSLAVGNYLATLELWLFDAASQGRITDFWGACIP
ncbi:hypothetical protein ACPV5O_25465 [Vibrio maritimus]